MLRKLSLFHIRMNEFNTIFENDDRDNRLFDTKRPLHYVDGGYFMLRIIIVIKTSWILMIEKQ